MKGFSRFVRAEGFDDGRASRAFHEALRIAERSVEKRSVVQIAKLHELLDYAAKKVPFYRSIDAGAYREKGIRAFPYVSRSDLRLIGRMIASGMEPTRWNRTSGSTNEPIRTALGFDHEVNQTAKWIRHFRFFPVAVEEVTTLIVPRTYRLRAFGGGVWRDLCSGHHVRQFHSTAEVDSQQISGFVIANPHLLEALFPSGWSSTRSCLITSYEQSPRRRDRWPAKVHGDVYGLSEVGCVAWRRSRMGRHWHVHSDMVYLELVNGRQSNDGVYGELAVTDLTNMVMPLIRYRTGDMVALKRGGCGVSVQILSILGRSIGTRNTILAGCDLVDHVLPLLVEHCLRFDIAADRERAVFFLEGASYKGMDVVRRRLADLGIRDYEVTEDRSRLRGLRRVIGLPCERSFS